MDRSQSSAPPSGPPPFLPPDLFGVDDYHAWLGEWFRLRKEHDAGYSYRRFAAATRQPSLTILEAIIAGRRNLTPARAAMFIPELGLSPTAAARLLLLVRRERALAQLAAAEERSQARAGGAAGRTHTARTAVDRVQAELDGLDLVESYRREEPACPTTLPALEASLAGGRRFELVTLGGGPAPRPEPGQLLRALHDANTVALARIREDPRGELSRSGRFLGLTQALAQANLPRVNEEIQSFLQSLVARFGRPAEGRVRPFAVSIDLFPLSAQLVGEARAAGGTGAVPDEDDDEMPLVYDFDDYRAFVARWFERRRAQAQDAKERFSLQTFAEEAALADRTLPHKVIAGKQALTESSARAFAQGMGLPEEDEEFLVLLVTCASADEVEKPAVEEAIRTARVLARSRTMRAKALRLFSEWYHFAIHEMAWCAGMPQEPAQVAAALVPPVTPAEATEAIRTLVDLGMFARGEDGRLIARDAALMALKDVGAEALHPALFGYHQRMHAMALPALAAVSARGHRKNELATAASFSTLALRLGPEQVPQLHEALGAFSQRLLGFCSGLLSDADRVFQVNLHILPVVPPAT